MKEKYFFFILLVVFLNGSCSTDSASSVEDKVENVVESQLRQWKEQQKFAEWILKDPATFDMDFKTEQDSLEITITESPDGNVRFYTWWDGLGGTMICNNNIYQTRRKDKVKAFDWRESEDEKYYPCFPLAIRQVESSEGTIYLLISIFTEWSTCHAYSVNAYKMDRYGELKPAKVFEYEESLSDLESDEENDDCVYIEIYGDTPLSLFEDNGWGENFFFDLSGEDFYLPNMKDAPDGRSFNDYFHHYHWNGERFVYSYLEYNPVFGQYIEPSDQLACEFELGKSFIRIEKMHDGTYRYIAWTREKMFMEEPDLIIENGWYHEVERVFHFANNDHEYVFDASEYQLRIYRTDSKTGKTEEIANYHIDDIYSQIPDAF